MRAVSIRLRPLVIALLGCIVVHSVLAGAAQAQERPEVSLRAIREQVLHADYRAALASVTEFVARDDLDAAQHNAGLEVLATIHVALRHTADAEAVLSRLYARDPGHRLQDPDASPPVIAAFGRARANPPTQVEVRLADRTALPTERSAPRVEVEVEAGLAPIGELRLFYRQSDGEMTAVVLASDGARATARIPLLDGPEAYTVHYYVEARAPSGHVLARLGSEAEPVALLVPERPEIIASPTTTTRIVEAEANDDGIVIGVVLGVVGAVVIAGIIVAAVLITDEVSGPQDGSLGNIDLPLVRF